MTWVKERNNLYSLKKTLTVRSIEKQYWHGQGCRVPVFVPRIIYCRLTFFLQLMPVHLFLLAAQHIFSPSHLYGEYMQMMQGSLQEE
jgi:hypothetical protein